MEKFRYNKERYQWERVDRIQEYKGIIIKTITYYNDPLQIRNHREYQLTYPNGEVAYFPINKRGGNIKEIKNYIDWETK